MNRESRSSSSDLKEKAFKIFGFALFLVMMLFGLLTAIRLEEWINPNPETASAARRLTADILFIPLLIVLPAGLGILGMFAALWLRVKFGGPPAAGHVPASKSYSEWKKTKAENPPHPSQWPFWLMALFFGGLFFTGLYFILQDMVIRHIPSEDWVVFGFLVLTIGAPALFAIWKIRQIRRSQSLGVPLESQPLHLPPALNHFLAYLMFGILILVSAEAAFFTAQETLEFQKKAQPAEAVVTRWVYHNGYRSGHYNVEVRYQTPDGKIRIVECSTPSLVDFLMPNVGERVNLLYNPYNPMEVRLAQFSQMWSGTILFGLIFAFFAFVGGFRLFIQWKRG